MSFPKNSKIIFWSKIFLPLLINLTLFSGCYTQEKIISQKTPKQVGQWSNEKLCDYAWSANPAIKDELLKRNLFNIEEYNYLLNGDHNFYPAVGMRKCAMWTCSNGSELIKKSTLSNGTILEVWKIHMGEYIFSQKFGGFFLLVTIEDDKIVEVSKPL